MATNKKENQFYKALEDIFVGAKIEGEGGFVNLLKMKAEYYNTLAIKNPKIYCVGLFNRQQNKAI